MNKPIPEAFGKSFGGDVNRCSIYKRESLTILNFLSAFHSFKFSGMYSEVRAVRSVGNETKNKNKEQESRALWNQQENGQLPLFHLDSVKMSLSLMVQQT